MPTREARLVTVARRYLPPAIAEQWIAMIRPAVRLRSCRRGEKRVGQLGGVPTVPHDFVWPVWEGEGSLNFVASIDCARLSSNWLDIPVPDSGTLLFFYFDDNSGYFDPQYPPATVGCWDPETLVGAKVVYIPAGVPTVEGATPADIDRPYEFVPLTAKPILTGPDWSHPIFRDACRHLPDEVLTFFDNHANGDAFMNALAAQTPSPDHRIGGYAWPAQDAVELDVAGAQLRVRSPLDNPTWQTVQAEGQRWTLLAQLDTDAEAEMMWGDVGTRYWLIQPEHLAARDFQASSFTWQCT